MFPSSHTRRIYDRYYFILLLLTNKILRGAQYGSNLKFITTMEVALLKHVDKIQCLCFLMNWNCDVWDAFREGNNQSP